MQIRVAVVGAGYWGPNLIRNFAAIDGCVLSAVCDLSPERLNSMADIYRIKVTTRLDDILSDPTLDAIAVATPAEHHYLIAAAALKAGKDVYVEKPLVTRAQEAADLSSLAEEKSKVLMVGHLFLYDPAVLKWIDLIQDSAAGKIRYIHSIRTSMSGTARLDTGIVWDSLIHDIYILCALFRRAPSKVAAVGGSYLTAGLEDVVFATFDFGDGILAQCYVSWYALEKARRMTAVGSDGILVYDDLADGKVTRFDRRYAPSTERDPQGRPRWQWLDEGSEKIQVEAAEPLRRECEAFIECVRTRQRPRTDVRHAIEVIRTGEAFIRSLRNGGQWEESS